MKNFLLTLIVCLFTGLGTYFCSDMIFKTKSNEEISESSQNGDEDIDEGDENIDGGDENIDEGDENIDEGDENIDEGDENIDEGDENIDEGDENIDEGDENIDEGDENIDEEKQNISNKKTKAPQKTSIKPSKKEEKILSNDEIEDIMKDSKTWSEYYSKNIELLYDFNGLAEDGSELSREDFLEELKTGKYVPINKGDLTYRLFSISETTDPKVATKVKSKAKNMLYSMSLEGKDFPNFEGTDLSGNKHTNELAKGKLVVVKFWFLSCSACIKEFPELNHIYDKYESNEDIQFLSFVFEKGEPVKEFLSKKEFRYPVIPDQRSFVLREFKKAKYPLHIIIGKDGKIKKIFNNGNMLEHFIKKFK